MTCLALCLNCRQCPSFGVLHQVFTPNPYPTLIHLLWFLAVIGLVGGTGITFMWLRFGKALIFSSIIGLVGGFCFAFIVFITPLSNLRVFEWVYWYCCLNKYANLLNAMGLLCRCDSYIYIYFYSGFFFLLKILHLPLNYENFFLSFLKPKVFN